MTPIQGLTFSYGKKKIFENLDVEIRDKFSIIKGPSGCGKTTLLKLLTGNLIPFNSDKELVPLTKKSLIVQEDALFPWMTGIENIKKIVNVTEEEITTHPLYQKISPYINQYAYQMSYGQRRMIELFRVILFKPKLLCLDEPFNFLDPTNRKLMIEYILNEVTPHTTVVMTTHYSEDTTGFNLPTLYFDGQFPVTRLLTEHEFKKL
ncbi:MAG: ATP-binding cassette domain-containing protein [Patescibacteria group bacterium]